MASIQRTYKIHVNGIVQGVGFRPFVYNNAVSLGLSGWVCNSSSGVEIVLSGAQTNIDLFLEKLNTQPPPLSQIDSVEVSQLSTENFNGFEIRESQADSFNFIPISPDISICADCRRELFDPSNRRFRYPFINCTNCGPRFSIIRDIPYDRPLTTMADFEMCAACKSEYLSPTDRRYHAQPIACALCGPQVKYEDHDGFAAYSEDAIQASRQALKKGMILAIKGLGGYHLACDANNLSAVARLHERKHRSDKPFALMCFDTHHAQNYVEISAGEKLLLESPQHPIVLLHKQNGVHSLDHTAPNQNLLGFMLPYTPLHLLLLEMEPNYPEVLVMTSGNISEEPIAYTDEDALKRLAPIADAFLVHNRPIHMRIDDSVVQVVENKPYLVRRARGYAPSPIKIAQETPQILACGAELKNTFSLSRDQYVFTSQHIGDLENYETLTSYEQAVEHYQNLYRIAPETIAVDLHPDYLSSRYGINRSRAFSLPLFSIQHHHAHLAACLGDNDYDSDEPVIGLIFDGTGYGTDGNIWGGEVFVGGYSAFSRQYHLVETALPGGDTAIRNPSKIALAYLTAAGIEWEPWLPPINQFNEEQRNTISSQLSHSINTPQTTSMGRLFDAMSSLIGIRHHITYEAQAAIELESYCDPNEAGLYDIPIADGLINQLGLIPQVILDMRKGVSRAIISARFHNSLARVCLEVCSKLRKESGLTRVALSGGVWQNTTLLQKTLKLLESESFTVLRHRRLPTNDGGISFGQIMITSLLMKDQ